MMMGQDQDTAPTQVLVAVRMVAMPMCIQHEANRLGRELRAGRANFLRERRERVIDQKHPIGSRRHAQIATWALEHREA